MKQGRVIINRNICDNVPECSGIEVCPTGALYWDDKNETLAYDKHKCIDCGTCADANAGGCPVGAILWGKDDEDYTKKFDIVRKETRTLEELEVERYGALPIRPALEYQKIENILQESDNQYVLIEFFSESSINCLLHSIKVKDIKDLFDAPVEYYKVLLNDTDECKSLCKIECFPALVVFRERKIIGIVNGYYKDESKSSMEFFNQIKNILKNTH